MIGTAIVECNLCFNSTFFTAFSASMFGTSSKTTGLFGQTQTKEGLGQNAGSLFGTPTLFTNRTGIFGQSSSGQTVCVHCFLLFMAGISVRS